MKQSEPNRQGFWITFFRIAVVACLVGTTCGCGDRGQGMSANTRPCPVVIPSESLPEGWDLLPSSQDFGSDKAPWLHENPQMVQGQDLKYFDVDGKQTRASQVLVAIYGKYGKYDRIIALACYTYPDQDTANAEFVSLRREIGEQAESPGHGVAANLAGFSLSSKRTILVLGIDSDCPDRGTTVRVSPTVEFFAFHDLGDTMTGGSVF